MIGTGLAILGAGLLGAGASVYGASKASKAQKEAADKAAAGQQQALEFQKANYEKASGNLQPFIGTGQGANNLLSSLYGLNGNPASGDNFLSAISNSPDYKFALKEGIGALENSAAARGGLLSGNNMRAVTEYGSGLATQNLNNYLTRLSGLSGQGIQAGGILGNIGTGAGNSVGASAKNIGDSIQGAGTAEASGIKGMLGGFNQGLNTLSLYNQLGKSSYGGGGTGFSLTGTGGLY